MILCILDGDRMRTRDAAHDELALKLRLPAYYGRNLDALWDVVSAMDADVTLIRAARMLGGLGAYGGKLLCTLYEASEENGGFRFRVAED